MLFFFTLRSAFYVPGALQKGLVLYRSTKLLQVCLEVYTYKLNYM